MEGNPVVPRGDWLLAGSRRRAARGCLELGNSILLSHEVGTVQNPMFTVQFPESGDSK
jgi:hypothetical protein